MPVRLIVHGGAAAWNNYDHSLVLKGMRDAGHEGWKVLRDGGTALQAVEAATIMLENHPLFDAGTGSHLNNHGEIELDALITDGTHREFGAVAGLKRIKNPIILARHILNDSHHHFFIGEGAEALAAELGIQLVPNVSLMTEAELMIFREKLARNETHAGPGRGTVGAVALDGAGRIATATSTGGTPFKRKGRVGDVPIYGAGGYSYNAHGGASTTGIGENIMRHLLSKSAVDLMGKGVVANEAAKQAVEAVAAEIPAPEIGVIVVDAQGRIGAAHTTAHMPIAWIDNAGEVHVAMNMPYNFADLA